MKCPNCGATVLKGDTVCKKCNTVLVEASAQYIASEQVRSRFTLFFKCWAGGWRGKHLEWLGYTDKAQQIKSMFGDLHWGFFAAILNPVAWIKIIAGMGYQVIECMAVLFGKYRTDAQGHPVRYFKGGKN